MCQADLAPGSKVMYAPVTPVCGYATSFGATAEFHLAAVAPNLSSGAELAPRMLGQDPAYPKLEFIPAIPVPKKPGVGVDIDFEL